MPYGATFVKLTLLADKRGHLALHDVYVKVSRLLTNQGSNHTGDPPKLYVEDVVGRLPRSSTNCEVDLARWPDGDVNEARFRGRSNERDPGLWGCGRNVQQKVRREAIRDINGQFKLLHLDFSCNGARCDPPRLGINEDVDGLGERRAALDVVVAHQAEGVLLREDRCIVVDRVIMEVKDYSADDEVAMHGLDVIARCYVNAAAVPDLEKAVGASLLMADGNLFAS
jgi:hypothetical protein